MNQKPLFTGVCTALVTPFFRGQVNYPMLERLLQNQLDAGIRAIVICGTTGESKFGIPYDPTQMCGQPCPCRFA